MTTELLVERVEFFRPSPEGRVHVLARHEHVVGIPLLYYRQIAACGRQGRPGIIETTSTFDDRELCARCWQATPADRRSDLFAHPQPEGASDGPT